METGRQNGKRREGKKKENKSSHKKHIKEINTGKDSKERKKKPNK